MISFAKIMFVGFAIHLSIGIVRNMLGSFTFILFNSKRGGLGVIAISLFIWLPLGATQWIGSWIGYGSNDPFIYNIINVHKLEVSTWHFRKEKLNVKLQAVAVDLQEGNESLKLVAR